MFLHRLVDLSDKNIIELKSSQELENERQQQFKEEDKTIEVIQNNNNDLSDDDDELLDNQSEKFVNDKSYWFLGKDYGNLYEKNFESIEKFDAGLYLSLIVF